ncbi:MAG: hypothetical protein Q9163_001440 [Psora crenata]
MGGGKGSRKRKRAQYAETDLSVGSIGMGATLAHIQREQSKPPMHAARGSYDSSDTGEWETVKPRKQRKSNYPSLGYSELHRLQSCVKLGDLQGLVLYCLADGTAPQWISVRHHAMIKKAVVLFVPGLEKGMFDGSILLQPGKEKGSFPSVEANGNSDAAASLHDSVHEPNHASHVTNNARTNRSTAVKSTSPDDYLPLKLSAQLPESLKPLAEIFPHVWPVKAPGDDRGNKVHSPLQAMLQSPITKTKEEKEADKKIKGTKPARGSQSWENNRTSIVEYLAKSDELAENDYVLHPVRWHDAGLDSETEVQRRVDGRRSPQDGWVDTRISKLEDGMVPDKAVENGAITAGRKILAMDCEMCTVQGGGSALTRISLVAWDGQQVMDELVKPDLPIIDYLTPYSGITPAKLNPVTTTLSDIQKRLLEILTPETIIVGHSLDSDLTALKMTHPFIVDTSLLYPHPRGPPMKSSLKWLAQKYLSREIQRGHGATGHDSVEDARACLDLVKLKCEKGPKWGTQEATVESIFKRLQRATTNISGPASSAGVGSTGAIIDRGAVEKNFGQMADHCIGCSSDAEVVAGVRRAVLGDEDGAHIPGGGVSFTWARLSELDLARGWRGDNRHATLPGQNSDTGPSVTVLAEALSQTTAHIQAIHSFLPPCTLLVVYSGTGDPREMARLQERHRTFKKEYKTKKWDEIADKWTDTEEQQLKEACRRAREGIGLLYEGIYNVRRKKDLERRSMVTATPTLDKEMSVVSPTFSISGYRATRAVPKGLGQEGGFPVWWWAS